MDSYTVLCQMRFDLKGEFRLFEVELFKILIHSQFMNCSSFGSSHFLLQCDVIARHTINGIDRV